MLLKFIRLSLSALRLSKHFTKSLKWGGGRIVASQSEHSGQWLWRWWPEMVGGDHAMGESVVELVVGEVTGVVERVRGGQFSFPWCSW